MRARGENKLQLLDYILYNNNKDKIVPGPFIASKLGISRQGVSGIVESLREEGIPIIAIPQKGYRIDGVPEDSCISPTWTEWLLRDCPWGHPVLYFDSVDSTQIIARQMAHQGTAEGLIVTTNCQTQGRGRRGREWFSEYTGGLYTSILLRPKLHAGEIQLISFAAGLALCDMLDEQYGINALIKWPNDILINGKKVCGILCESAGEPERVYHTIVGLGINANQNKNDFPESLRGTATSIRLELGRCVSRCDLLASVTTYFYNSYSRLIAEQSKDNFIALYRNYCLTLGQRVLIIADEDQYRGTAEDVTGQGALIVNIDGARHTFAAADIIHLRADV